MPISICRGKGQFLLTLAAKNPQINYIGIERYSSVLLRAVEKFQELEAEGKAPENCRRLRVCAGKPRQEFPRGTTVHAVLQPLQDA